MLNYLIAFAFILGIVLLSLGKSQRTAQGEWSNGIQWGYLLLLIAIFGALTVWLEWSFTATLLAFTLVTGVIWLWHKRMLKKWRAHAPVEQRKQIQDPNHFRDYMAGFFPIIAVVFVLRTFIAEPFQIPSSSMRPGLVKGDFILVNKFTYGLRIPVLNSVFIPVNKIERADVVVFNYPLDPKTNYIKRIVAVGGDTVEYKDKILSVNGQPSVDTFIGEYEYPDDTQSGIIRQAQKFSSQFENKTFDIAKKEGVPSVDPFSWERYQNTMHEMNYNAQSLQQNCQYAEDGSSFTCKVPEGMYFAMGDNRDASADSRYWGFVDDRFIVGKAFLVWLNLGELSRIGTVID